MDSARRRRLTHATGIGLALVMALILGLTLELSDGDTPPVIGLAVAGEAALITAVIGAAGDSASFRRPVVEGLIVGAAAAMLAVVGDYIPYAAHVGQRTTGAYGGEAGLGPAAFLVFFGLEGAVAGAACGALAWAIRVARRRLAGSR